LLGPKVVTDETSDKLPAARSKPQPAEYFVHHIRAHLVVT
jgi:hypothetical protein